MEQTGRGPADPPAPAPEPAEVAGRGRGRPGLLTGELAAEMYKLIRVYGLTDSRAGLLAGASTSSVSRWKDEDPEFRDYLETAWAEFEVNRTLKLLEATRPDGSPDWRAHAWLLKNAQAGEARKPGRPRQERDGVSVSECASETGGAPGSTGAPSGEFMVQKIPENDGSSRAPALALGMETGGENSQKIPDNGCSPNGAVPAAGTVADDENLQKIPENRPASSGPAPAAVTELGDENTQKIPENDAHRKDTASTRRAVTPGLHETISEKQAWSCAA